MAARRSATQGPSYSKSAAARKIEKSISIFSPPRVFNLQTASSYSARASSSPKNSSCSGGGTPNRKGAFSQGAASSPGRGVREYESSESKPLAARQTMCATSQVDARMETQSSVRQAGTTPAVLSKPRVGFRPIKLLNAAGTRPDPAVSVPRENVTRPLATATAEPELEPPNVPLVKHAGAGAERGARPDQ